MNIVLKPQKRKSIGLYPQPDYILEVRYPYGMPHSAVDAFIDKHRSWAEEALKRKNAEQSAAFTRRDKLPFLGVDYPILEPADGKIGFYPGLGFRLPEEDMAECTRRIYRMAANDILPKKVAAISERTGLKCTGVKITSARTRWGSCNGKNGLNFSLYLMMAPESAVDYVIIHELAHTVHHDHSRDFWALVRRFCPNYEKQKAVLDAAALRRRAFGL